MEMGLASLFALTNCESKLNSRSCEVAVFYSKGNAFARSRCNTDTWRLNLNQVAFEGTRGSGYRGDIAVDDVMITPGTCGGGGDEGSG